jgi:nucleotidyltransferase substrate binding protein (TIGR01987 family)
MQGTHETLDLTVLRKALKTLAEVLDDLPNDNEKHYIRDASIQRFEYSYELTLKMLRRHLENIADNPGDVKEYAFQDVIREGYNKGVLQHSWDEWKNYRVYRNKTSHGYNEKTAKELIVNIPYFLQEAQYFLERVTAFYDAQH